MDAIVKYSEALGLMVNLDPDDDDTMEAGVHKPVSYLMQKNRGFTSGA
jgi:hypothetical protein